VPVAVRVRVPVSAREPVPRAAREWASRAAAREWVTLVAARERAPLAAVPVLPAVPLLKRPEPWNCWTSCPLHNR